MSDVTQILTAVFCGASKKQFPLNNALEILADGSRKRADSVVAV